MTYNQNGEKLVGQDNHKLINQTINEDCLIAMSYIEDNSVDMVLCDLPYG